MLYISLTCKLDYSPKQIANWSYDIVVVVTIDKINQQQNEYPKLDNKLRTFGRYCPHIEIQNNEKTTNDDDISPLNLILTLHNTVEHSLYKNKSCETLFHWFKCVCKNDPILCLEHKYLRYLKAIMHQKKTKKQKTLLLNYHNFAYAIKL